MKTYWLYLTKRLVLFAFEIVFGMAMLMPVSSKIGQVLSLVFFGVSAIGGVYSFIEIIKFFMDLVIGAQEDSMVFMNARVSTDLFDEKKYRINNWYSLNDRKWVYVKITFVCNGRRIVLRGRQRVGELKQYAVQGRTTNVIYFKRVRLIKSIL